MENLPSKRFIITWGKIHVSPQVLKRKFDFSKNFNIQFISPKIYFRIIYGLLRLISCIIHFTFLLWNTLKQQIMSITGFLVFIVAFTVKIIYNVLVFHSLSSIICELCYYFYLGKTAYILQSGHAVVLYRTR